MSLDIPDVDECVLIWRKSEKLDFYAKEIPIISFIRLV